jgi:hypothetical protein
MGVNMTTYTYVGLEWDAEDDELIMPIIEALEKKGIVRRFEIPEEVYEKMIEKRWKGNEAV